MRKAMLKLEVFELANEPDEAQPLDPQQAERLEAAFEEGYASGWQDALEHLRSEDDLRRIAAEEAIQAVRFTYAEAHQVLQRSFMGLVQAMLEKVLPEAARLSLPDLVRQELAQVIRRSTHAPIQIICAPSATATMKKLSADVSDREIEVLGEPSFSEAQVSVHIGRCEHVVDLSTVIRTLERHLENYLTHLDYQEAHHG